MSPSTTMRQRMALGDVLLGTMVTLESREVAEILSESGFDWLCLDSEHGPLEPSGLQGLLQAAGRETSCIIRVPALNEAAIKHALDAGAVGVMVPQVHTVEEAALAVQWSRYPPAGTRGMGVARAHHYGFQTAEYLQQANEQTVVIVQAESAEAVRNIDAISQVKGLDAVLIGPYDLSASLGRPGDLGHPDVQDAIGILAQACHRHNLSLGIFGMTVEAVRPFLGQGFRLILVGVDATLLGQAARDVVRVFRS